MKPQRPRESWAVYRFGISVAVSPTEGPTQYLTPAAARTLAAALLAYARDIERADYVTCDMGTCRVNTDQPGARARRVPKPRPLTPATLTQPGATDRAPNWRL